MANEVLQTLLRRPLWQEGQEGQGASPMGVAAKGLDMQGIAKILLSGPQSGPFNAEGRFNTLGGAPGGYSDIRDLLNRATPSGWGMFKS